MLAFVTVAAFFAALSDAPAGAAAAGVAAPAGPLRHLEYAVTQHVGDAPASSRLDVDLTGVTPDRGLTFRLVDRAADGAAAPVDAHLERSGALSVTGDGGFSDGEQVLLAVLALSFDDVAGLTVGDAWTRVERSPDGSAATNYQVKSVKGPLVELTVSCSLTASYGYVATWHGEVTYDAAASAPTSLQFTGESPIEMKLMVDSFAAKKPAAAPQKAAK